jgi:hypothetical protein
MPFLPADDLVESFRQTPWSLTKIGAVVNSPTKSSLLGEIEMLVAPEFHMTRVIVSFPIIAFLKQTGAWWSASMRRSVGFGGTSKVSS